MISRAMSPSAQIFRVSHPRLWFASALIYLACSSADAICVVEPLKDQLAAADVIYIGTIVQSTLSPPVETLRKGSRAGVQHKIVPQIILRGDPSAISDVLSAAGYSDPRAGRFGHFPELVEVAPGDSLLIVGKTGKPSYIGLCSASRTWDVETEKLVRSMFPSMLSSSESHPKAN
jgi:hypothetical protein